MAILIFFLIIMIIMIMMVIVATSATFELVHFRISMDFPRQVLLNK